MSFIMLGNMTAKQMCERLGIEYTEQIAEMEKLHQNNADVKRGADVWHCFDIPFVVVCGTLDVANKWRDILLPLESKMNGTIHFALAMEGKEE